MKVQAPPSPRTRSKGPLPRPLSEPPGWSWTFCAPGATRRKVTRRSGWTRGYWAPRTLEVAGWPSGGAACERAGLGGGVKSAARRKAAARSPRERFPGRRAGCGAVLVLMASPWARSGVSLGLGGSYFGWRVAVSSGLGEAAEMGGLTPGRDPLRVGRTRGCCRARDGGAALTGGIATSGRAWGGQGAALVAGGAGRGGDVRRDDFPPRDDSEGVSERHWGTGGREGLGRRGP